MFANVAIEAGEATRQITVPQTAITYNPYGDTVFVVQRTADADGKPQIPSQQRFVKLGRHARRSGRRA